MLNVPAGEDSVSQTNDSSGEMASRVALGIPNLSQPRYLFVSSQYTGSYSSAWSERGDGVEVMGDRVLLTFHDDL